MKRLLAVCITFGFLAPLGAYAQSSTPQAAATAYFNALKSGGFVQASQHIHPDEAERFKDMLLPLLQAEAKSGKRKALQTFLDPSQHCPLLKR